MIINRNGIDVVLSPEEESDFNNSAPQPFIEVISVSARQFKLQLLSRGILDQVDTWVSQQGRDIQIAYEYSTSFLKSSEMLKNGFQALGFTKEQIDNFFIEASKL